SLSSTTKPVDEDKLDHSNTDNKLNHDDELRILLDLLCNDIQAFSGDKNAYQ
ncbi:unnamed protein product, partial [Rotaria magnacalcarata]